MRLPVPFLLSILFPALFPADVSARDLPEFRPAMIGNGPKSLINLIDGEKLIQKGQTDGLVMFACTVSSAGRGYSTWTYRGSPNTIPLRKELEVQVDRALFLPAVYQHKETTALVLGTATFGILNGKPRVRIFMNQEAEELKNGNDFISPQIVQIPEGYFQKRFPAGVRGINGRVDVQFDLDNRGEIKSSKVIAEIPPDRGVEAVVKEEAKKMKLIPAFRNGKPVAYRFTFPFIFNATGMKRWKS